MSREEEALALLRKNGLPDDPLERATDGEDNIVYLAPEHVVRLRGPWGYDHRREAEVWSKAVALHLSVPSLVDCGETWSIWSRLKGQNLSRHGDVDRSFWTALFADLVRIHSVAEPEAVWKRPHWWVPSFDRLSLAPETRAMIEEIRPPEPTRLTFAHGDLNSNNVIVSPDGSYAGIVDWADAGAWPPEIDYALLRADGLRVAKETPPEPLDWRMVAYLRLTKTLAVVSAGVLPIEEADEALDFYREVA